MYKVLVPFQMQGQRLNRGTVIGNDIESKKNFSPLLKDKYIVKMEGKDGSSFISNCYIAERNFNGRGKAYRVGDLIDLRNGGWANESSLIDTGYLRYATEKDVEQSAFDSPLSEAEATPCLPSDQKKYKSLGWLVERYVDQGATIPEMAEEASCSTSTIWSALNKAHIETRSQGRNTKK